MVDGRNHRQAPKTPLAAATHTTNDFAFALGLRAGQTQSRTADRGYVIARSAATKQSQSMVRFQADPCSGHRGHREHREKTRRHRNQNQMVGGQERPSRLPPSYLLTFLPSSLGPLGLRVHDRSCAASWRGRGAPQRDESRWSLVPSSKARAGCPRHARARRSRHGPARRRSNAVKEKGTFCFSPPGRKKQNVPFSAAPGGWGFGGGQISRFPSRHAGPAASRYRQCLSAFAWQDTGAGSCPDMGLRGLGRTANRKKR